MNTSENNNDKKNYTQSSQPVEGEERSRNRRAEEPAEDGNGIYLASDSKLQSKEEYEADKNSKDKTDEMVVSSSDDHETNSGGRAGTDRAGTAERKDYGDLKLNLGIEEQGGQKIYDTNVGQDKEDNKATGENI